MVGYKADMSSCAYLHFNGLKWCGLQTGVMNWFRLCDHSDDPSCTESVSEHQSLYCVLYPQSKISLWWFRYMMQWSLRTKCKFDMDVNICINLVEQQLCIQVRLCLYGNRCNVRSKRAKSNAATLYKIQIQYMHMSRCDLLWVFL